jgi:hypothetical protein
MTPPPPQLLCWLGRIAPPIQPICQPSHLPFLYTTTAALRAIVQETRATGLIHAHFAASMLSGCRA